MSYFYSFRAHSGGGTIWGMKNILYTIILFFLFSFSVFADFQAAQDAYDAGDYETARKEWKALAEQGDVEAQYALGAMYHYAQGVTRDYKEAAKWYRMAAELGADSAQLALGYIYEDGGYGGVQDYKEAVKWFRLAAEQGDTWGQFNLGKLYKKGEGVTQDYVIAHMWINISISNGNERVKRIRDEVLANRMTSEQITKAEELARECIKKNYKDCG
jgi:hypothetical protein